MQTRRRRSTGCSRPRAKASACRRRCASPASRAGRRAGCGCGCGRSASASARPPAHRLVAQSDVTRERERQENVFQELQHAIDYLDHAPAGFFSVDAKGDVVYLNATLANWLDQDLAQVGSGGLKLCRSRRRRWRGAADDAAGGAGRAQDRGARPRPQDSQRPHAAGAALPQACFRRRRHARRLAHACAQPRADDGTDPQRAAEIRFMRFFHHTPMAIATVDREGRHRAHQSAVRAAVPQCCCAARTGSGRPLDRRHRSPSATAPRSTPRSRRRPAARATSRRSKRRWPGDGERFGRFYVTAVEEEERDQEAAIVYTLETTDAARARDQGHPDSRRWSSSASSPAASLTTSTTCSPPSSWRPTFCSMRTSRPIRRSATSCRSSRMPTGRRAWCGICSPSRASRRCARRCSISARS